MEKVSGKVLDKANHPNFVEMWRVKPQLDFGNSTPKQSLVDTCVCASSRTTVHISILLTTKTRVSKYYVTTITCILIGKQERSLDVESDFVT